MSKEAMKLALEALEVATTPFARDRQEVLRALAALRKALAEQPAQQEPFKWSIYEADGTHHNKPSQKQQQPLTWLKVIETPGGWGKFVEAKPHEKGAKPVYTSPPAQRTWVGLTNQERENVIDNSLTPACVVLATEAKLKEKNT